MATDENTTCNVSVEELLKDLEEATATIRSGFYPALVLSAIGFILQVILLISVGYLLHRGKLPWKRFTFVLNQCCADLIFSGLYGYAAYLTANVAATEYDSVFKDQSKSAALGLIYGFGFFIMIAGTGNYSLVIYFQSLALHKPVYYATRLTKTNVILHICGSWFLTLIVSSISALEGSSTVCPLATKTCSILLMVVPVCLLTLAVLFSLVNYLHIIVVLRSRVKTQQKLQELQLNESQSSDEVSVNLLNYFSSLLKFTKGLRTNIAIFGLSIILPVSFLWLVICNVMGGIYVSDLESSTGLSDCEQKRILLQQSVHVQSSAYFRVFSIIDGPLLLLRVIADPIIYFVKVAELNLLLQKYWTFIKHYLRLTACIE